MVFSSLFFLCVFLPLSLALYYVLKNRTYRNWVLIIASLFFYAWGEPVWVTLLVVSTLFDYYNALVAERNRGNWKGKAAVAVSIAGNLLILGFFKYSGFVAENLNSLLGTGLPVPAFGLPIGISFYTFQTISYVIDVYRGETEAQRSFPKLLLFVSLFHQLVAGPIVRYREIAGEIEHRVESWEQFNYGASRFIMGLGKKVLIANTAGELCEHFLGTDYARLPVAGAWLGIFLFALQIYYDFSGYSDMAIGLGKMFGFTYKENFNYPYISRSATEFWRRWHISLGSFFRDYLYIPLGGNRRHQFRNLLVVWFLTGLWHGASWNFVIWGLYYFLLIAVEKLFLLRVLEKLPALFSRLYLWAAVLVGWVFFYHLDLGEALEFLGIMFGLKGAPLSGPEVAIHFWNSALFLLIAAVGCIPFLKSWEKRAKGSLPGKGEGALLWEKGLKPLANIAVLVLSIIFLVGQSYNPFLYFRF
ncbi:MAG TPA: MBOAT family O-acyltransferase [Bacillota bacterium]|nr:MBOAT family protein [Bacillota bacterium]HOB86648.1 MBOAT family O-acyltransferase [Bacillota bacterium]HOP68693.1 MBOAT family O-acyltransferase [Bacillota bacterium]HPT33931.1 MBOAT family O-acyltransferase [Bacillota bacterium]HPZ64709.1 MBOAT family O-acyltransferase [Bacillota bacterium]